MGIRCIIIDDEPLAIQVLETHLKALPDIIISGTYNNPLEAFSILNTTEVDLIFLDIEMPLLNGLDFIKNSNTKAKIIFTTAHRDYAPESYELEVTDYLLKPISFPRLFKAINRIKGVSDHPVEQETPKSHSLGNDHLYVNANKKYIKVRFDAILYIESIKDYVRIHTDTDKIVTKETISNFEQKLPREFLRVHRSYLVNTKKVTAFTKLDIEIGKVEIPIGASYKATVIKKLQES